MSRYIDADLMREKAYQMNFHGRINERELFLFNRALSEMPTVDAVPVEWIKNFIKRTEDNGNTFAAVQYEMMLWDYLADGERRTDEQH